MPATPQLFSTTCHPFGFVQDHQPAGLWRQILTALIDRVAAEGYEDEQGFHFSGENKAAKSARVIEPVCLGENI